MSDNTNNYKAIDGNLKREDKESLTKKEASLRNTKLFYSEYEADLSKGDSYLDEAQDLDDMFSVSKNNKGNYKGQEKHGLNESVELNPEQVDSYLKYIFQTAVKYKSSDVHIDNVEEFSRVRYRVEGKLILDTAGYTMNHRVLVQRLKLMAEFFLREDTLIQKGYAQYRLSTEKIVDFTVICLPTSNGEKIVLKLADTSARLFITEIGMTMDDMKEVDKILEKRSGLVIVSGLIKSGRSTTLYALLDRLSSMECNIMTIENKIFEKIEGVSQISMQEQDEASMTEIIKHLGEFDIDIVVIDAEFGVDNFKNILNIALSGKLVIMTAYFPSAYDVIVGLTSMGIEPYAIAASLEGIIAQNLVRKICPVCLENRRNDRRSDMKNCKNCSGIGFKGKTAVFEIFKMRRDYWSLILNKEESENLKNTIKSEKCSFENNCKRLVTSGVTSVSEILRIGIGKNSLY